MKHFNVFLFLFYSYAGFSTLRLLKRVDEKIITVVENFAREELLDLLETQCRMKKTNFIQENKLHLFGPHALNPSQFRFSDNDKKLILSLSRFAEQIFESDNICSEFEEMHIVDQIDDTTHPIFCFTDQNTDLCEISNDTVSVQEKSAINIEPQTQTHRILEKLLVTANRNATTTKAGYRFDPEVKKWAAYLRMLSGPIAYNTLQKNLELALPSLSGLNQFIQNTHHNTIEGVLRHEELFIYLTENKLPLAVALSEDATFIVDRPQYNSKKNQLSGFVLPLNADGMPIPFTYNARNTEEIVQHFVKNTSVAKTVITVMAQPIIDKASPFPLLIFGADNKFSAEDVSKRWKFISKKLSDMNILVLTFSSDSDPKYNKAMKKNSRLGRKSDIFNEANWFKCKHNIPLPFYVQDTVHLGTKARNLFLKTNKMPKKLLFGKYYIKLSHIQYIVDNISKDQHEITQSVLDATDRQNFDSVLRICNTKVFVLLEKHVKGSEGTIIFLKIVKNFLDAYLDQMLTPLQRVSKLWYSTFMIRMWRVFIINNELLTLRDNFITSNTYSCMELNAHSMVNILLFLKETNQPNLFKPWLYSSQPCESFFRQIRSFTPCYSTVTNCSVKEIIDRIHKIELQNEISRDSTTSFVFHQKKIDSKNSSTKSVFELPNEQEILETINECKIQAIKDSIEFGLISEEEEERISLECHVAKYVSRKNSNIHDEEDEISTEIQKEEEEFETFMQIMDQLKNVHLKNYADQFDDDEPIDELSPYTEVFDAEKRIILKKQSLVWLLRKNGTKLSSDRLQRVKCKRTDKQRAKKHKKRQKKIKRKKNICHFVKYLSKKYIPGKKLKKKSAKT